jgi:ribose 5-phosphate isomerase RpiB
LEKLQEVMVKLGVVDLGNGMVMAVHEQGGVAAAMAASSSDSASTQREKRGEME